jgi:hypothetical protein
MTDKQTLEQKAFDDLDEIADDK